MSLYVSPTNGIIIQNSSNTEKFNSTNKLLYKYYSWDYNSITIGGASINAQQRDYYLNVDTDYNSTLSIISVNITSCNGNMGNTLLNAWIQLNVPILVHRVYDTNTAAGAYRWEIFSACIFNIGSNSSLLRFSLHSNSAVNPLSTITFTPKLRMFKHSY